MNCPECSALASDEDLFCGACGAILADPQAKDPADVSPADTSPAPVAYSPPPSTSAIPDSRARVAVILGLVSIGSVLITCLPLFGLLGCFSPVVGISAIVLGSIAKQDVRAHGGHEADWKRAQQGVILGIVGVALYVVVMAVWVVLGLGRGVLGEW